MTKIPRLLHAVNLSLSRVNKKSSKGSLQRYYFDQRAPAALQEDPLWKKVRMLHYRMSKKFAIIRRTAHCWFAVQFYLPGVFTYQF